MSAALLLAFCIQGPAKEPAWTPHGSPVAYKSPEPKLGQDWEITFEKPKFSTQWFQISPDGSTLTSIDINGRLVVWDARTGGLLGQIQLKERVQTHIWSPDSKTIALGGVNLWLWDVADKRATQWPEGSIATTRIAHLAYSPDGKLLAAVHNTAVKGNRCALRFWTVKDKKVHKAYEEPLVYDIAFCKSVPAFFFWPKPNNLPRKRNLVSDQDEPLEPPAEYPVLSYQPAIRHDDRTAYWYSLQDDGLIGYDMVLGKKTLFIPAKVGKVSNRTVVSPDGKWALTGFSDASKGPGNRVLLWNLDQKKLEKEYRGHQAGLRTLAFTNDNRSFITRDVDGNFFRWDVPIP